MAHMEYLYHYRAKVFSVYDGDTIRADVDLGFRIKFERMIIRLARIDAPELRGEERPQGLASRDYLRSLILGKEILLQTIKDRQGKYGRYLGEIWLELDGQMVNINNKMVEDGYAVYLND